MTVEPLMQKTNGQNKIEWGMITTHVARHISACQDMKKYGMRRVQVHLLSVSSCSCNFVHRVLFGLPCPITVLHYATLNNPNVT